MSGKFVQVSSGNWSQVPPFSSVHSVQFTNSSDSDPDDQAGSVRPKLSSIHRVSNCLGRSRGAVLGRGRVAERFGALASSACVVMRGAWVRAPCLLGHAALQATEGISEMMFNIWL